MKNPKELTIEEMTKEALEIRESLRHRAFDKTGKGKHSTGSPKEARKRVARLLTEKRARVLQNKNK